MNEISVKKSKFSAREIVLCGLFTALIAVGAFIKVPIGIVPMSLQTLFVVMSALLLGPRLAGISVVTYIFIGLIGFPIFTQGGGITYLLQPTFGYIIGFAAMAVLVGLIVEKSKKQTIVTYIIASIIGLVALYICGLIYFYLITNVYLGKGMEIKTILISCCAVFIPTDVLSCILAAFTVKKLKPLVLSQS